MKYSAEEVDHIFNVIDSKGDGVIDREEFVKAVTKVYRPLSQIQDIIKRNRLDIEDICFRIEIDMNRNEVLDYIAFKGKMKKLDYTFSDAFITDLFHDINNGEDYVDTQSIISAFDVFKKEHFRNTNNATFTKNDKDYDPYIKYKLIKEDSIEYLISLGVAGLKRVLENNEFTVSQKVTEVLTEYEEENNPIIAFINDVGVDAIINQPTHDVYLRYTVFCSQSQLQALSKIAFSKQINKRLNTVATSKRINGNVVRLFMEV